MLVGWVALSHWIVERPGYGNMFILERCEDMASVPLAHLVADLSYPETKLDELMSRLQTWAELGRVSVDALNTEAPQPVFAAGQGQKPPVGFPAQEADPSGGQNDSQNDIGRGERRLEAQVDLPQARIRDIDHVRQ
jgi:hypothetical protein